MSLGWEILMPPFDFDLGDAGKGPSDGWMFFTWYNTERATGKLEVTARSAIATTSPRSTGARRRRPWPTGKGDMIGGVKVIDPEEGPGLVFLLPCGKSPHGVDVAPNGN